MRRPLLPGIDGKLGLPGIDGKLGLPGIDGKLGLLGLGLLGLGGAIALGGLRSPDLVSSRPG